MIGMGARRFTRLMDKHSTLGQAHPLLLSVATLFTTMGVAPSQDSRMDGSSTITATRFFIRSMLPEAPCPRFDNWPQ
jgi:hypothetical protein